MHPFDHARSSAGRFGGEAELYQPLHRWFDATKIAYCDFRHRALRHHRQGIAEAEQVFGSTIALANDRAVAVRDLGLQHLEEDGSRVADAADWLVDMEQPAGLLPEAEPSAAQLTADSARRFGGTAADYAPLHSWFLTTRAWVDDRRHLMFRHHAFGVFEAEARFGIVLRRRDGAAVPTRVVAERHVRAVMGRVPPAHTLLRHIRGQRWMTAAHRPDRIRQEAD